MSVKKYSQDHEWIQLNDGVATIGISQHAVDELGEIVYIQLPKVGTSLKKMDEFGSVESVKTVSSLYAPIGGEVTAVNQDIVEDCALICEDPENTGWIIQIRPNNVSEMDALMNTEAYDTYLKNV